MEASTSFAQPAMDPASLRALALSTLKAKKKRPPPQQPTVILTSRPIPTADSFQLDYGQEESNAQHDQAKPMANGNQPPTTDIPDISMREEGEISDEEEPRTKPGRRPSPVPRPKRLDERLFDRPTESRPSLLDRISDPSPGVVQPISEQLRPASPRSPPAQPRSLHTISTEQVRPNLHLNQTEYDKAKDIILDLLGWGVPPEYLVDLGLTREIVFYVFSELNLRLPANLDTSGLLPYAPNTVHKFTVIPPEPSNRFFPTSSIALSPTAYTRRDDLLLAAEPSPFPPKTVPKTGDLHDMERQRREELRARKAAQASLRARTLAKESKLASVPAIPSEAVVDDFLKSITPTSELRSAIPPSTPEDITMAPPDPSSDREEGEEQDNDLPVLPSPVLDPPPSSTDSLASTFAASTRMSPKRTPPIEYPLNDATHSVPQYPVRRGIKRPVASDFVDFDGYPRPNSSSNSYDSHATFRQKTGTTSFVNVRTTKCVIDLSDSETEAEDDAPIRTTSSNGLKPPVVPTVDPSILEEKEREIQRMRELIAQHERKSLLKKLGLKAGPVRDDSTGLTTTPNPGDSVLSTPSPANVSTATSLTSFPPETPATTISSLSQPGTPSHDSATMKQNATPPPKGNRSDTVVAHVASEEQVDNTQGLVNEILPNSPPVQTSERTTADSGEDISGMDVPEAFTSYDSLFTSYPSLRMSLPSSLEDRHTAMHDQHSPDGDDSLPSFSPQYSTSNHFLVPDLTSLRAAALTKRLDPNKQICRFEVPGGGICRDGNCDDLHLSRLGGNADSLDLSDEDVARFLRSTGVTTAPLKKVLSALHGARLSHPTLTLEPRVAQALESLQPESWISSPT